MQHYTIMDGSEGPCRLYPSQVSKKGNVYISNAKGISILGCKIRNSGLMGVMLDLYSQENNIFGNEISDTGYAGVYLTGIPDVTQVEKTPERGADNGKNIVSNNYIHHTGRLAWHGAGVMIFQSGNNDISFNSITDIYRQGIFLLFPAYDTKAGTAINNLIRFNRVKNVNTETSDTGGINNWNAYYTTIDSNKITDVGNGDSFVVGIYLDDFTGRNTVKNNIVYNINAKWPWTMYFRGKENSIYNNIFVSDGGYGAIVVRNTPETSAENANIGHRTERNIYYAKDNVSKFMELQNINDTSIDFSNYNLFFSEDAKFNVSGLPNGNNLSAWKDYLNHKYDQNSLTADPSFVDAANRNYKLKPNSPAFKLGFSEIREDLIGTLASYPFEQPDKLSDIYLNVGGKLTIADMAVGGEAKAEVIGRTPKGFEVDISKGKLIFASSNPEVATVDNEGNIHTLTVGESNITARLEYDGMVFENHVLINCGDKIISFNPSPVNVATIGQRVYLDSSIATVNGFYAGADRIKYTIDNSDKGNLIMFDDGSFMGRKQGEYKIKATAYYCGDMAEKSITVNIVDNIVESLRVKCADQMLTTGDTLTLLPQAVMRDGDIADLNFENAEIAFSNEDNSILSLDGNKITALKPGSSTITYKVKQKEKELSGSSLFTVGEPANDGFKAANIGGSGQLVSQPMGSVKLESGKYTIATKQKNVWGIEDDFTYLYKEINLSDYPSGVAITATIESLTGGQSSSMCGLMIRNGLGGDDAMVHLRAHQANILPFVYRQAKGSTAANISGNPAIKLPITLRLVKKGDTITGYINNDGEWKEIKNIDIPMKGKFYIGVACATDSTSVISNLTISNP